MKIVLTQEEIREVLIDAAHKKISEALQFAPENCFFDNVQIEGLGGSDHCIEDIEFVCSDT